MDKKHDVVSMWVTKRDSFGLSCDGIESKAVLGWFQRPKQIKPYGSQFAWSLDGKTMKSYKDFKFIPVEYFGVDENFPFVRHVWAKICSSEIGECDFWGSKDSRKHDPSSPNHYSNWLWETKVKFSLEMEPSLHTCPIWITKAWNRQFEKVAGCIEKSQLWFRIAPFMHPKISDDNPDFPCWNNATLEEVQTVPDELNESDWDQSGGAYHTTVDNFFKHIPNTYRLLKELTKDDFPKTAPSSNWMTWCKSYHLHVEILES